MSAKKHQKKNDSSKTRTPFVAVGASAGGLEAAKALFSKISDDCGMAFVLIQHLVPDHKSNLASIMRGSTALPVEEAGEGTEVNANHLYVIPAGQMPSIKDGSIRLEPMDVNQEIHLPIDHFFCALAEDQQELAFGIILSGTGSDGTVGVRAIKSCGGLVIVQSPQTAEFDGMPRSVMVTGLPDYVLPVEEMAEALSHYVSHFYIKDSISLPTEEAELNRILSLLHARLGCNFRSYKRPTLVRRIQRRMGLHQLNTMSAYMNYLREHPNEAKELYSDFLIGVTGFFRDPGVWDAVEHQVINALVQEPDREEPLRIWVPGCSTGEEAYTVAMLVCEKLAGLQRPLALQVFATDIDEKSLAIARTGFYPRNIEADISPERLNHFFYRHGDGYMVDTLLRDCMVFSAQNLIGDPPFSRIDLISCRNLMIYLEQEVQQKVIRLFHFSLRKEGYLVLGNSETIGQQTDLLDTVSKPYRIFRRIGPRRVGEVEFPIVPSKGVRVESLPNHLGKAVSRPSDLALLMQRELLTRFAPASVLIDRNQLILYLQGDTSPWLQQPAGVPTLNLFSVVLDGLSAQLRGAVKKAREEHVDVVVLNARVKRNGQYYPAELLVSPVASSDAGDDLLLVTFSDKADVITGAVESIEVNPEDERVLHLLETELKSTREELQSTIEVMDSSNEELKASHEEVMSMNEELQSSNEELETSKEELQSLNEELHTVNAQLQDKILDLEVINNDLMNLVSSTEMAILFLDEQGIIRRFTPAICDVLCLIDGDLGRSVRDIALRVDDADFFSDIDLVMETAEMCSSSEVQSEAGRWYRRRTLPYRVNNRAVGGVVIVFDDISVLKQQHVALREAEQQKTGILDGLQESVILLKPDFSIEWANQNAVKSQGKSQDEVIGYKCFEVFADRDKPCRDDCPAVIGLKSGKACVEEELDGDKVFSVSSIPLLDDRGEVISLIKVTTDITLQKNAQMVLEQQVEDRTHELMEAKEVIQEREMFLQRTGELAKIGGWELRLDDLSLRLTSTLCVILEVEKGYCPSLEQMVDFFKETERARIKLAMDRARSKGIPFNLELELTTDKGAERWVRVIGDPQIKDGVCIRLTGTMQDITARKVSESEIESLARFPEDNPNPVMRLTVDGTVLYANDASQRLLTSLDVDEGLGQSLQLQEWIDRALTFKEAQFDVEVECDGRVLQLVFAPNIPAECVNVYGMDITQRKRGQEKLAHSEEQLRFALDAVADGIWEWFVSEGKTILNDRSLEMFGFDPQEPCPSEDIIFSKIHVEDLPILRQMLQKHIDGEIENFQQEFRVVLPDGSVRWILGRGRVIERDDEGGAVRFIGTNSDITIEKRSEEELLRMQNLESLGTLAGGIAHDFNNILMGIFGNISLAKMMLTDDHPGFEVLNRAELTMPRATKLTGQLLTFAKGGEPITDSVLLSELAEEIISFDLMGSNVKLKFACAEQLWRGEVDRGQIQQVFSNLAINAREAMPDGGLLHVSLENKMVVDGEVLGLKAGAYIQIKIRDEGAGIAPKHLARIFDPYFTTKQLGNGLGLATVYSVVKRHGGVITVESKIDQGSEFTLYLPASEVEMKVKRTVEERIPMRIDRSLRVLLMDDEEMIRLIVPRMLEKEGFVVQTAMNGQEAVTFFESARKADNPFDLVILDLTIPGESGGQTVLRKLQEIDSKVIAIVASGYAGGDVVSNYEDYGFKGMVVKPFLRKELVDEINRALHTQNQPSE